jgi:hypothetical protein
LRDCAEAPSSPSKPIIPLQNVFQRHERKAEKGALQGDRAEYQRGQQEHEFDNRGGWHGRVFAYAVFG